MGKNVGSVNLDELRAAREALDRERGIESDPNMYNNYDPEGHKAKMEEERLARESKQASESSDEENQQNDSFVDDENIVIGDTQEKVDGETQLEESFSKEAEEISSSGNFDNQSILDEIENMSDLDSSTKEKSEIISNTSELPNLANYFDDESSLETESKEEVNQNSDSLNFDMYDSFSDFEINSGDVSSKTNDVQDDVEDDEILETDMSSISDSDDEDDTSLDDFLKELDNILEREELEEAENDEESSDEEDIQNEDELQKLSDEINDIDDTEFEDTESLNEEGSEESSKIDDILSSLEDLKNSEEENKIEINSTSDVAEPIEYINEEDSLSKFMINEDGINLDSDDYNEIEILTNLSEIGKIESEIEEEKVQAKELEIKQEQENEQEEIVENEKIRKRKLSEEEKEVIRAGAYKKIKEYNFVDVISSKEFKNADPLSYVIGKDDEENIIYNNLNDTCGTFIYSKDLDIVFNSYSSILLSLLLKNTPSDIQFVLCDAVFDSEFDVFNDSSYMYLNRVAKNNREIVDSLLELSKELENRYNNLVYAGVKSISAYNVQAEERGTEKMPYIVLFVNNYAKISQFLDSDKINICLHNILKFGRIVGVYAFIASAGEIDRDDVNFNLPTRISFMADDSHDSIMALGRQGAEDLEDEKDFLYSTVYDEEIKHLKVADISRSEIEVIIENLEK